jgi:hypothetical protein
VPTRQQVLELIDGGHSYESAGRELHIPAGQVFMIATGLPADGSDVPSPEDRRRKPLLAGGSQHLLGPPPFNPTGKSHVLPWVAERARRELSAPRGNG